MMRRMQERLTQIAIGREQKKARCVFIESTDGIKARVAIGWHKVCNTRATMRVAHSRDVSRRLVEYEIGGARIERHGATIDFNPIDKRIDFSAHLRFDFAVNGDPAGTHEVL